MPLSIDDDIYNLTITASDVSGAGAPSSNQTYTFTNTGLFWQGASATEGVNSGTGLAGLTPRYFYYSSQWQLIQEDASNPNTGATQTADQYVWGMAFVNELVLRDSDSDGESSTGDLGISGSGLDQRLYVQQDANWNVTALINTSGTVVERYTYDPYGNVTVLNPDGTIKGNGSISASGYGMAYLFQGGRQDVVTGLINFQHRDYNPVTATWMEQDPKGYVNGLDLYIAFGSNPIIIVDPRGLDDTVVGPDPIDGSLPEMPHEPPPGGDTGGHWEPIDVIPGGHAWQWENPPGVPMPPSRPKQPTSQPTQPSTPTSRLPENFIGPPAPLTPEERWDLFNGIFKSFSPGPSALDPISREPVPWNPEGSSYPPLDENGTNELWPPDSDGESIGPPDGSVPIGGGGSSGGGGYGWQWNWYDEHNDSKEDGEGEDAAP